MIIIYAIVLIIYFMLFLLVMGKKPPSTENGGRGGIFYKAADYIYGFCRKRRMLRQEDAKRSFQVLCPEIGEKREREERYLRQYYIGKIRFLLLFVFIGNLLAICLFISSRMEGMLEEGRYIRRNGYGEGNREMGLQVQVEGEAGEIQEEYRIVVEEQNYEEAVIKQMAKEISPLLPNVIKGGNPSLEKVRDDLNLVRGLEGYPFQIDWESDDYSLVYSDGCVTNEAVGKEGKIVNLTAVLTYGDYREEHIFPICIYPPEYTEEEIQKKKIYELLVYQEEKERCMEKMELPDSVDGKELVWSQKKEDSSISIFLLISIGAVAIYLLQDKKLKEKVEQRNRQMLLDYPQLISKLVLYMGAGMTIRNAFQKVASNYRKEKRAKKDFRYVYEEMLLICHELDSGISEAAAYEHFGKRCRLPQYTKLSNILVQNLKKGSNGILDALRQEAKTAFEERKNVARKLGEEAGTKLLLPMMLMLGIVMVLIIVPAYLSFSA
ncbi:secretion protein F [Lachnospiraceae bacterium]|nr:secretion protein F [Lachnospiraceae bacterium]